MATLWQKWIVRDEVPVGHEIISVELSADRLHEAQQPAFITVVVSLRENENAQEMSGVAYEITKQIREKWSRDDLYIRIQTIVA